MTELQRLKRWEAATQRIVKIFVERYFGEDAEYWWVGKEVGGVLFVNDCWFGLRRIIEAVRYEADEHILFDYYELELAAYEKNEQQSLVSFKNYVLYAKTGGNCRS